MTRRSSGGIAAVGALAGILLAAAVAAPASAHDALDDAAPAADATVTTLTEVELTFTGVLMGGEGADVIQVIGPDGKHYETGCPVLDGPVATAPVAAGPAGRYEVDWRVVSSDGHPIADSYTFAYEPAADVAAAPGADASPCGQAPSDAGDAPPVAAPDPGLWIGLGIGAVVAAAVGVGAWLLVRRPRDAD